MLKKIFNWIGDNDTVSIKINTVKFDYKNKSNKLFEKNANIGFF